MLEAVQRGKYAPLYAHLNTLSEHRWDTTFGELEQILEFELPNSSRIYRPWWANQDKSGHSQSMAWMMAGWKTANVDLDAETLAFVRDLSDQQIANEPTLKPVPDTTDGFWVYENWTHDYARVHSARCPHCNHGKGAHPGSSEQNGRWIGPFASNREAFESALNTGRVGVESCKVCSP